MGTQIVDEIVHRKFNGVPVRWRRESRYSQLCGFDHEGNQKVLKVPVPITAARMEQLERRRLARRLNEMTTHFLDGLLDCGVFLARNYVVDVDSHGFAIHMSHDEGLNSSDQLKSCGADPHKIFSGIIRCIRGVLTQKDFVVGIDGRLENFAGDERYVDVFPPLVKIHEGYNVHYPNPTDPAVLDLEIQRKFTAFGILRRLRFDVLCLNPAWESIFLGVLRKELPETLSSDLFQRFVKLRDSHIADESPHAVMEYLEGLRPEEVEARREIAARLIPQDDRRDQRLYNVFTWTSSTIQKSPGEFQERLAKFNGLMRDILLR